MSRVRGSILASALCLLGLQIAHAFGGGYGVGLFPQGSPVSSKTCIIDGIVCSVVIHCVSVCKDVPWTDSRFHMTLNRIDGWMELRRAFRTFFFICYLLPSPCGEVLKQLKSFPYQTSQLIRKISTNP